MVTEQVSHHPPVTAMFAESEKWVLWQEYNLNIKFRGQVSQHILTRDYNKMVALGVLTQHRVDTY